MIEIVVGTALLGMILASALALNQKADSQTRGRNTADVLASFQQLAGQYFISNRANIEAAMGGDAAKAASYCQINVPAGSTTGTTAANSTLHTCAFDTTQLAAQSLWPTGAPLNFNGTARYVAIVRQVLNGGTPTGADEMLIVMAPLDGSGAIKTTGTVTFTGSAAAVTDELQANMAALGGSGGFVPPGTNYGACQYNGTTKQVCGTSWSVSLADFLNSP